MRIALAVAWLLALAPASPAARKSRDRLEIIVGSHGAVHFYLQGDQSGKLAPALQRLGCVRGDEDGGEANDSFLDGRCSGLVQGEGNTRRVRIDFSAFWKDARAAGQAPQIRVAAPVFDGKASGAWRFTGGAGYGSWTLSDGEPGVLEFEVGVTKAVLTKTLAGVAVFVLIPVMLAGALWWTGRKRLARDANAILFDLEFSTGLILQISWLVWISLSGAIPVAEVAAAHARPHSWTAFLFASLANAAPPMLVLTAGMTFVQHLKQRVRPEPDLGAAVLRAVGTEAAFIVPLSVFLSAHHGVQVMAGMLCAYGARQAILIGLEKTVPMRISPLEDGDLRDRVFALAAKAQIKLKEAYLMLRAPGLEPNAFALAGERVMISSELVNNMSAREVDAVMAHEVGHIKAGHTAMTAWLLVGSVAGDFAIRWLLDRVAPGLGWAQYVPFGPIAATFLVLALSRRHEFEADRASGELTGDPEAMISALGKLARITRQPIEWSGWQDRLLTHPSVRRRANALGAHFSIAPERVEHLLSASALADRLAYEARDDRHADRADSFQQTQQQTRNLHWARRAVLILMPMALALAAAYVGELGHPGAVVALTLGGFLPCLAVLVVVLSWLDGTQCGDFGGEIRALIEKAGFPIPDGAMFVGYSPGGQTRIFDNADDWDFGFLVPSEDRVLMIGCKARFAIPDDALLPVETVRGLPGWIRTPRVKLEWRTPSARGAINLMTYRAGTSMGQRSVARKLAEQLEQWRLGRVAAGSVPDCYRGARYPDFSAVSGAWHKSRIQLFFAGAIDAAVSGFLAMCVCSMVDLRAAALAAVIAGMTSFAYAVPWMIWWAVPDRCVVDSLIHDDQPAEVLGAAGSGDGGGADAGAAASEHPVHSGR